MADASHDLRTPLAGVIAGSEQLLREPGDRAVREQRLVAVVREARRAARLVDDVLLMARLEQDTTATPPVATSFDLVEVLDQEIHHLALRYPSVQFRRSAGAGGTPARYPVAGDADQLRRALGNELDNAARFSTAGVVDIAVDAGPGDVAVWIQDSGPGVPEQDRERIFDRFVRLDTARQSCGSGLGLPIGRAVVERHGGSVVCVAPAPGTGGGLFAIRLPLQVPAGREWRPEPVGIVPA